jgi:hypothetical protein
MFVCFRKAGERLKVYLAESRREGGQPRQETVAYLGAIEARHLGPQPDEVGEVGSVDARVDFWIAASEKFQTMINRIGGQAEVNRLSFAIQARIPFPAEAERDRALRLAGVADAMTEQRKWSGANIDNQVQRLIEREQRRAARAAERSATLIDGMRKVAAYQTAEAREQASLWEAEVSRRRMAATPPKTPLKT